MKKYFFTIIPLFSLLAFFPFECAVRDAGIFKSENKGEIFKHQVFIDKKHSLASVDILTIEINPQDSKIIYLGTRSNGLYKSADAGESWFKLEDKNGVLSLRANIYDIAIDASDTNRLYLGAYQDNKGRVFRSQDAGDSWEEVYVVSKEQYAVFAAAVDNYDPAIVYIGTAQGGFLKSADFGKSWKLMRWFDDVISDIVVNPQDTRVVYLSTFNKGIYKTNDKGLNWESFEAVLKEFRQAEQVEKLVIDAQRPNIIYAGSKFGLLRSNNSGGSWQPVNIIIPPESTVISSLATDPQNTDHLYYGAGSVLYRSLDQGENWTVYEIPSKKLIKDIAVDPVNPEVIYVGMGEE
ncbi:MAG: hypothetical protein A3I88_02050 [Candidatus Portnoybacteria bacterium RIFCSPLOWO2_12_FULL_39_9]|uniref:Sortilin N-terminal domain-containing protein n=1 Tax=Candidatus Portnoybacteria bacterium RIFCSPHIGHO2_12_FULL_38_9 TaxID=1801997 RepID=A0A1G2FEQ0_9BACT|nr:MAG: hypothetical protein A3H00_01465 [Candidatus Portnoybacteria bacterium RBG_13_40_8]OGZ35870.1 MAG: hypothetical protein A2646_01540 [Candidatus Portnoybacteria bacterium RIFCSPHIGHO2_02_FULL_39_12]OGZ36529.1 MAG: hypothetical protein A3J64_02805 [Candidatus Portnoybacteria bacterium RIFCSPHIGHO2_12_FULL_38_9]OGZ41284.1 MAG: hypothetical protein A3I88_02050 [Candidatus Portnoybacteria bacterium RIFCSPLOWO2_12_FULL_39_9]